jgi:NADH:ubiquinone oxidoreductase subunit 5 (subunit L)/multisubunit Na+/H+ antiporter MnhA subunit
MENFLWVIPAAPLAAFLITILFGRDVLKSQAHWPGIIGVGISFICAILTFFQVLGLKSGE